MGLHVGFCTLRKTNNGMERQHSACKQQAGQDPLLEKVCQAEAARGEAPCVLEVLGAAIKAGSSDKHSMYSLHM